VPLNSYKSEGTSGEAQGIRESGLSYTPSGHEWNRIILYRPIFSPFVVNSAIGTTEIRERRGARQNLESSSEEQEASIIEVESVRSSRTYTSRACENRAQFLLLQWWGDTVSWICSL
jgi:hypothetical protein